MTAGAYADVLRFEAHNNPGSFFSTGLAGGVDHSNSGVTLDFIAEHTGHSAIKKVS